MAITTLDGIIAGATQRLTMNKTANRTAVGSYGVSVLDLAGNPGAGVLAGTSTTTGVVPTQALAGFPPINAFGVGNTGYITRVEASNIVSCRITLFDMLWKGGAYAFNAAVSGNTPASFASRVPNGTDFTGLQLWYEQVTASTLVPSVNVAYLNESGEDKTTGVIAMPLAMIVGRMHKIPLAPGDKGIQGVTGVTATVASAGTFNLLVLRHLDECRIRVANDAVIHDALSTGMPIIFEDSALMMIVTPDSTASQMPELIVDITNG